MAMAANSQNRDASEARRTLALALLPLLDLTSLGEDDTPAQIESLCAAARNRHAMPAAVCVYPEHITTATRALHGTRVRVATVVNFPDGSSDRERVLRETRRALAAGADEIDLVLPQKLDSPNDRLTAQAVVRACRELCSDGVTLKAILETGALQSSYRIRQACDIGLGAGVDFLKTSTGKAAGGATLEATAVMLDAIAAGGGQCGIKVAGGVRSIVQAEQYLAQARARFGSSWITPAHFRIGASSLFDELVTAISMCS
jgi:deoxyribose-phosphate aldolase